jgi:hypothetical protein
MLRFAPRASLAGLVLGSIVTATAHAQPAQARSGLPDGAALIRLMGKRAVDVLAAPGSRSIGALVTLPLGQRASDLGLRQLAPGVATLRGTPENILAFADTHPEVQVEVAPPLHTLLDTAAGYVFASGANREGLDGSGVLVGIADTGLDLTHPDFLDVQGHTRVAWLIDLSAAPRGIHPDLEKQFGSVDGSGNALGAVWSAQDIDAAIASRSTLPQDELGHGTLVSSCAAGNGSRYRGVAPGATILLARITQFGLDAIDTTDLLQGVAFLFDRADVMKQPVVVNLSIGTDFGPHDGTMAWEQTLAGYVGPAHPGRAIVAAAGNSGSIVDAPVHQNVHVSTGSTMRVPILTNGAQMSGGVQVWVAMRPNAGLSVGLDGPDGEWIAPVAPGGSEGKNGNGNRYNVGIYNGSQPPGSPVPRQSAGAFVAWQGKWPPGTYSIALSGSGTADLYVQGTGDAAIPGMSEVGFANPVRESTINLPATSPSIIGVGCTINKKAWRSISGVGAELGVPVFDSVGGVATGETRLPVDGEPCWFSSAGPTLTGLLKPEIMAPGAAIVGALSQQAVPPAGASIFTNLDCPSKGGGVDPTCQQIDPLHGVSFGTSFSSPIVAGTIAVMLQHDPTLTQDAILAALQGGAHRLRGAALFDDQAGVGEVDVLGALAAVDRLRDSRLTLPIRSESWLTLGADQYLADGSAPLQAIVELRAQRTSVSPPLSADGFDPGRLAVYALVDGRSMPGAVQSLSRRGPGVWVATLQLPLGLGGSNLTVGATFDGNDVVQAKSIPIGTDAWNADYPPGVRGGCAVGADGSLGDVGVFLVVAAAGVGRSRLGRRSVLLRALTTRVVAAASRGSSAPSPPTSRPCGRGRA